MIVGTGTCGHLHAMPGWRTITLEDCRDVAWPCPQCQEVREIVEARANLASARMTLREHGIDAPDLLGDSAGLAAMVRDHEVAAMLEMVDDGYYLMKGETEAHRILLRDMISAKREAQWWLDAAEIGGNCPLFEPAMRLALLGSEVDGIEMPPIEEVEERIYRWASIDVLYHHYADNWGSDLIVTKEEAIEMIQTRTDWSSDWTLYEEVLDHTLDPANRTRQERMVQETAVAYQPVYDTSNDL